MTTTTIPAVRPTDTVAGPWGSRFRITSETVVTNVSARIEAALWLFDDMGSFEEAFSAIAHLDIPAYYASLDSADRWGSINQFWQWVVARFPLTEAEVAQVRATLVAEAKYFFTAKREDGYVLLTDRFDGQM